MLNLNVSNKKGNYKLNLPTSIDEIDESYIIDVTSNIKPDANYSVIGVVYREKLSTLVIAAKKNNKKSDISVIPVFVKSGKTNSEFIKSLNIKERLIVSPSDIMLGFHVSAPNNLLTINTILNLIDGDINAYNQLLSIQEYCYFIDFKLVPNCNIHGAYEQTEASSFVNPFVTKIADVDAEKSDIIIPKNPKIII